MSSNDIRILHASLAAQRFDVVHIQTPFVAHYAGVALAAWPDLGSSRDHVREGLRARRCDRYVIFYRVEKKGIAIVRVLHERRDVDTIFADGE